MARTVLESLITRKALDFVSVCRNDALLDLIDSDQAHEMAPKLGLKNVCARVSPGLAAEISEICNLLEISQRSFLEAAFIEAVNKAHSIMKEEGVWEAMEGGSSGVNLEVVQDVSGEAA